MITDDLTTVYADYFENGAVRQLTVTAPHMSVETVIAIIGVLSQALNGPAVTDSDRSLGPTKVLLNPRRPADILDTNTPIEQLFHNRVDRQ